MPKNFDEKRAARAAFMDRDFILGGEQFTMKASVRPEALVRYESLEESDNIETTMAIIDDLIIAFLEPGSGGEAHNRYRTLRERESDPISVEDLQELVEWMMEVYSARPTVPPGDSSESPGTTGTSSTDDSSSPDIPVEPVPSI